MKRKFLWIFLLSSFFPAISNCQYAEDFLQLTVPEIAEKVSPSIVTIIVYNATGSEIGQGSGFFVTKEGAILTNAHVVKKAYSALVISEKDTFDLVTIWVQDETMDLALISVPVTDSVVPLEPADSQSFKPGERVVAIGNPFGLEKTISDGLISAIRRVNEVELIQTTAPISPGSSGGPLLDMFGRAIGVTTSTFQEGQNLNFAVSINTVYDFFDLPFYKKTEIRLKRAGERVWFRVILKWIGNIFVWIIGLIFGGYWAIPIIFVAVYLIYLLFRGIYLLFSYPFRKAKERREAEAYRQYLSSSYSNLPARTGSPDIVDEVEKEESEPVEEEIDPDYPVIFYCRKCGDQLSAPESKIGKVIECQSCHTRLKVPKK